MSESLIGKRVTINNIEYRVAQKVFRYGREWQYTLSHEKIDGTSLMPLISGLSMPEQIAYSETGNPLDEKEPPKEPNTKSVRTSKWKLILNQYNDSKELYNLEFDPNEEKNLFGREEKIESFLLEQLQKLEKVSN